MRRNRVGAAAAASARSSWADKRGIGDCVLAGGIGAGAGLKAGDAAAVQRGRTTSVAGEGDCKTGSAIEACPVAGGVDTAARPPERDYGPRTLRRRRRRYSPSCPASPMFADYTD